MLSKLLESMLAESGLRPINSTQIRPTEELRIHLFNDDQLNNHRIQITDSEDPFRQPGLPEYEHQNPSAHLGEAGTPDGLYACLSTAQRQTITCVGGTPSAVAMFSETDLFDVTINNTSYVNQTFEQLQTLLEGQQVEMVSMVEYVPPVTEPEPEPGTGNEPGDLLSLRYLPNSDFLRMQLDPYQEAGSTVFFPEQTDIDQLKKVPGDVLNYANGETTLNLDLTKALPFVTIKVNDTTMVRPFFPDIAPVLKNEFIDYIEANSADDKTVIISAVTGTVDGDMPTLFTPALAVEQLLPMSLPYDADHTALLALAPTISSLVYSTMPMFTGLNLTLNNPVAGGSNETTSIQSNIPLMIPNSLNGYVLPTGDTLTFSLSESVSGSFVVGYAYTTAEGAWTNDGMNTILVGHETAKIDVGGATLYEIGAEGNFLFIDDPEVASSTRAETNTAVWIFIPNKTVNVNGITRDMEYDVKHFSNGTCIYFYLKALND